MARRTFLVSFFIVLGSANAVMANAPLAPEEIKSNVEKAVTSNYGYNYNGYKYTYGYTGSKTYAEVAQDVLASTSLTVLCSHYSLSDISNWNGGNAFLLELKNRLTIQDYDVFIGVFRTKNDIETLYYFMSSYDFSSILQHLLALSSEHKAQQFAALLYSANATNTRIFSTLIPNLFNEDAKQRLFSYIKLHLQAILERISLDSILTETTPTVLHMFSDYETTSTVALDLTENYRYNTHKTQLAQFLCTVIKDEKKLIADGYSVFFHSQRWDYLFVEKLYTDLWALTNHKNRPTTYLFPHLRVKGYDPLEQGPLSRTSLLKTGRTNYHNRKALLFVNNSLLGKYKTDCYSSSLHFFLSDSNINHITIDAQQVFEHYKLIKLFKKHKTELSNLELLYNQARTFGTLLVIAVPQKMVQDYCFAAIPGGYKNPDAPDIVPFLNELASQKSNKLNNEEFCLIMLDEAMNPEGGLLIKAYHCAEATAYKQFEAGYEKLITSLQKEVAAS